MAWGRTVVVRDRTAQVVAAAIKRVQGAYVKARDLGDQRLQSLVPRLTGALASSSVAELLEPTKLLLRSYGDESAGKAYARWVNGGHHTQSGTFVPANPYFSQSCRDVRDQLVEDQAQVFG